MILRPSIVSILNDGAILSLSFLFSSLYKIFQEFHVCIYFTLFSACGHHNILFLFFLTFFITSMTCPAKVVIWLYPKYQYMGIIAPLEKKTKTNTNAPLRLNLRQIWVTRRNKNQYKRHSLFIKFRNQLLWYKMRYSKTSEFQVKIIYFFNYTLGVKTGRNFTNIRRQNKMRMKKNEIWKKRTSSTSFSTVSLIIIVVHY